VAGSASAIAHGAATMVNAIALGKGAAFGVDLWTKAMVELSEEPHVIEVEINPDKYESTLLVEKTLMCVLKRFHLQDRFGAKIKTVTNIPIARGLKSSSTAANAVALATIAALDEKIDDLELVKLGVQASFDAHVTITGAFDDACASYFGGAVATDNKKMEVVKRFLLPGELTVLFQVPPKKAYTINSDVERLNTVRPLVQIAFDKILEGKNWEALTLNGLIYSSVSNQNPAIAIDALAAGAVAAGLCGKGPAITTVVSKDRVDDVRVVLQKYEGEILEAKLNFEKAKVL
jgi:shikimate kinase